MKDFFLWQMDYVYFFYGLAGLVLSVVCYAMMKKKPQTLPWVWLALFGIFHGAHKWLEVISGSPWNGRVFNASNILLMSVSYIFLLEFGRAGVRGMSGKGPGRWIFIPLLTLSFLGGFKGLDGFDAAARYSLGLTGGLLASAVFFLASGKVEKGIGRWLAVCGAAMVLYALATGVGVPPAPFVPASLINRDIFFQTFGVPVQLIRGICLVVMASSIWVSSRLLLRNAGTLAHAGSAYRPVVIIVMMVIAGWGITEFAGNVARQQEMKAGRLALDALRNYFAVETKDAAHDALEKASNPAVRTALVIGRPDAVDAVKTLFDCKRTYIDDSVSYHLIDDSGRVVAECGREGDASAEKSLRGRKHILQYALSERPAGNYFFDSGAHEWAYYAFAGVKDAGGRVIGAVISKRKLGAVEEFIGRYPFCFLIDPHGVVFISSREEFCLKSLWPLPEDIRKEIADSGQFGPGPFSPLMSSEAVDGKFVAFYGQNLLVSRQLVDDNGWSLVLLSPVGQIKAYRFFAMFTIFVFCSMVAVFYTVLHLTRQSAAQVLSSERRYRSLVESSSNCVMLFEGDGRCVKINKAGLKLLGCREEEIVGRRFDSLRMHDAGRGIDELFADVLKGNRHSFEAEVARPDGKQMIFNGVLNPVRDADGRIRSFVGIFMDITERKETEKELRRYQGRLEERVKERTAELSEVNKRLAQEIAERTTAEEELKRHRERLSELVKEQTADLMVANDFLQLEITDRKKAEDDLRKHKEHLEEIVRVRTAELSNANERLKLINMALKDSEERFRSLFNLASDCILLMDAGSEPPLIVDANIAACEMNGYEYKELVGKSITELDDEESRKRIPDVLKRIMSGEAVTFEVNHVRKNGVIFPVEVSAQLIHLSGRPYILAIDRDITQRKRMEEKLVLFSRAVEETMDGVQITNLAGDIVYSNRAITEIYGYSHKELLGRHVNEMNVDPGFASREIIPSITKAGRWNGELAVRHKDGREFTVWLTASIIKDAKGDPFAMVGVIRDITGRKQAEEELKRHREHLLELVDERTVELKTAVQLLTNEINFRKKTEETLKEGEARFRMLLLEFNTLLDALPDALILISSDLSVKWANKAAESIFGRKSSEMTGHHCYEMLFGLSEQCEECFAMRSFSSGNSESSQRALSSGRLLDGRAFPIMGEDGVVGSVIVVFTDITEKTALQAEAMRASHLAALGELAAGVAHEINNPINGIINYAQILTNKIASDSKENEISQRIIKEGDRIAGIVRSLLSFARERKEDRSRVAMHRIIEDTVTLTETQIRKDGIDLSINISGSLSEVVANPQQIQQVFLNVISNARYALNQKYPAADKDKKFLISGEDVMMDESPYVRVTFYDSGAGIPADIIDKVMHPFFSTKPSGKGTGLGLSISHGIIQSHGGRLSLESVEGVYTKVTIDLPAKEIHG